MRLFVVLALGAPVAVGIYIVSIPGSTAGWVDAADRPTAIAIAAALIGATVAAIGYWFVEHLRFRRLVKAAERIAGGDYTVAVTASTVGGGLAVRLARAINGISRSLAETHDRATIDRMTGVADRQALLGSLFAEVERATRYERPLCVAFVDIDHFKTVNDTYGHAAGDVVLRGVAQTLSDNLRASDLIGRYGGEEFMLILTETDVEDGAAFSEKLRVWTRSPFAVDGNKDLTVTISIGIVGGMGQHLRENLIRDADAAQYSAKSLGRNQTYIFEEPDETRASREPRSRTPGAPGRGRSACWRATPRRPP